MVATHRILIIDDDADIVCGTTLRLRSAGYATTSASDGPSGIEMAESSHPDAILLDVRMPDTDGLEVLARLRARDATRRIPVVMLSASLRDRLKAAEAGARFFVAKPYQGKTLIDAVYRAINEPDTGMQR